MKVLPQTVERVHRPAMKVAAKGIVINIVRAVDTHMAGVDQIGALLWPSGEGEKPAMISTTPKKTMSGSNVYEPTSQ